MVVTPGTWLCELTGASRLTQGLIAKRFVSGAICEHGVEPCGGQFDAVHAATHQLDADLIFEIADLPTEGRLCCVEGAVAIVPSISSRHGVQLTKSFS
jgi:hypothetical protein